ASATSSALRRKRRVTQLQTNLYPTLPRLDWRASKGVGVWTPWRAGAAVGTSTATVTRPYSVLCRPSEPCAPTTRSLYVRARKRLASTQSACASHVCYLCPRASIAARTFGGDIGNSVSRVPTARSIALAIAAIGGQMLTSAAPLAPYA